MRIFFSILSIFLSLGAMASNAIDSVGVENQNGTQLILHKVEAKETYYSIARLYNVSPRSVIEHNKNIPLHVGTIVKVPTNRPFTTTQPAAQSSAVATDIITYKVGRREYLYAIARRFNTTVDDIKQLNNLTSNNLSIGQILKIRQGQNTANQAVVEVTPQPAVGINPPVSTEASEPEKPKIPTSRLGLSERNERGVAVWISDENMDGTKMLALHRTAPIGTVVKITNPMTERVTFVKVVGKFTENETTKDVIIVITKATADLLGALDKRFQVSIDYGMPNE